MLNMNSTFSEFRTKYVPRDINMLRMSLPTFNHGPGHPCLFLFDLDDIQNAFKKEGRYPSRGDGLELMALLRSRRDDIFKGNSGKN